MEKHCTMYIPTIPVGLKSSRDMNDKHRMGDVDGKTLYIPTVPVGLKSSKNQSLSAIAL